MKDFSSSPFALGTTIKQKIDMFQVIGLINYPVTDLSVVKIGIVRHWG